MSRPDHPFDEPWQARAFALAVVATEGGGWGAFQDRLKEAVAADPERPYWDSFLAALEAFSSAAASAG